MSEEDEIIIEQAPKEALGTDYEAETQDERRRVFSLAVVVDRTEPMRLSCDDFMAMCSRVNQWLRDGIEAQPPAKPTLRGLPGGKA